MPKPVIPTSVLALKYSCFVQTPCAKTPEFGFAEFWDCLPDFLWRNLVGVSSRRTGCVLNRQGLCVKELNLLLQLPQDVSTRLAKNGNVKKNKKFVTFYAEIPKTLYSGTYPSEL